MDDISDIEKLLEMVHSYQKVDITVTNDDAMEIQAMLDGLDRLVLKPEHVAELETLLGSVLPGKTVSPPNDKPIIESTPEHLNKELWIAGYPSPYGGADSEIYHNILLWRKLNVDVHLVPMFGCDQEMKNTMRRIGCTTHKYNSSIFSGKNVISYCNGEFLSKLPEIMDYGRPAKVFWANCMTWLFEKEIEAHRKKWIDYFIFVSKYQEKMLRPQLEKINPVTSIDGYKPYYDIDTTPFKYNPPGKYFGCGRISRDDGAKFSGDMWRIFDKVCTPISKKVFVLGWGENAYKKCGEPPSGMDFLTYSPNSIPVSYFYKQTHCIIHKTGGSRESYCRIVPECYAQGVPIIVERDYAFPELIVQGETGFMCSSSEEMSYRASQLAFDESLRKKIIYQAREHLKKLTNTAELGKVWRRYL